MKVFEEIYGSIFTSEEEKNFSKEYSRFLEDQIRIISNTETENDNGGDILGDNFSNIANSISENKTSKNIFIQNQDIIIYFSDFLRISVIILIFFYSNIYAIFIFLQLMFTINIPLYVIHALAYNHHKPNIIFHNK
jgi:hypothetical protein